MKENLDQQLTRLSKRGQLYLKVAADPKRACRLARLQHLPQDTPEEYQRHYKAHGWQFIRAADQIRKDDNERS